MFAAKVEPSTAIAATAARPARPLTDDLLRDLRTGEFSKRKISILYFPFFFNDSHTPSDATDQEYRG